MQFIEILPLYLQKQIKLIKIMKLSIGTFAKSFNQAKVFVLVYKNENASIYSIKLGFRKFALITIKNK